MVPPVEGLPTSPPWNAGTTAEGKDNVVRAGAAVASARGRRANWRTPGAGQLSACSSSGASWSTDFRNALSGLRSMGATDLYSEPNSVMADADGSPKSRCDVPTGNDTRPGSSSGLARTTVSTGGERWETR